MINYYQISQEYTGLDAPYYRKSSKTRWRSGLKNLVTYTKSQKKLQLLGFETSKGGHAILIKQYKGKMTDSAKKTWYKFLTYDSNYPKGKIYVYVQYVAKKGQATYYPACTVKGTSETGRAVNYGTVTAFEHTKNFGEFKNILYK
jgi:hypothetical protein